MNNRDYIRLAAQHLNDEELRVWIAHYLEGYGRRTGALMLDISEDTWRTRLTNANRKLAAHLKEPAA